MDDTATMKLPLVALALFISTFGLTSCPGVPLVRVPEDPNLDRPPTATLHYVIIGANGETTDSGDVTSVGDTINPSGNVADPSWPPKKIVTCPSGSVAHVRVEAKNPGGVEYLKIRAYDLLLHPIAKTFFEVHGIPQVNTGSVPSALYIHHQLPPSSPVPEPILFNVSGGNNAGVVEVTSLNFHGDKTRFVVEFYAP